MGDSPKGKDDSKKEEKAEQKGKIESGTPSWRLVIPIAAIITVLVAVLIVLRYMGNILDCDSFPIITLIYPMLFGAAGVVLGGYAHLEGRVNLFGVPWGAQIGGGIAAALIGLAVVKTVEPANCVPPHTLNFKGWPVREPANKPKYFAKIDFGQGVQTWVSHSDDNVRDLAVNFSGSQPFRVSFQFYRIRDDGNYEEMPACHIQVEPSEPEKDGSVIYELVRRWSGKRYHFDLTFDEKYFERMESAKDIGGRLAVGQLCMRATANAADQSVATKHNVIGRLYVSLPGATDFFGKPVMRFALKRSEETPLQSARNTERDIAVTPAAPVNSTIPQPSKPVDPTPAVERPQVEVKPRNVANCSVADDSKKLVDQFIAGDDLDLDRRRPIYKDWQSLHCYVWPLISGASGGRERVRGLRLLSGAILNFESGYWTSSGANKRDFSKTLPYLKAEDLRVIFNYIISEDDLLRAEAARFVRSFPVDGIESLFKQRFQILNSLPVQTREHFAIAASSAYYNRIVEWLDETQSADKNTVRSQVEKEFESGRGWAADQNFTSRDSKPYQAMLLYAKGIVERELKLTGDGGKATFSNMLAQLRQTGRAYPSNHRHIAQALAIAQGGEQTIQILGAVKSADPYAPETFFDAEGIQRGDLADLFAGPRTSVKVGDRRPVKGSRLLLRSGDWHLVHGKAEIGWVQAGR